MSYFNDVKIFITGLNYSNIVHLDTFRHFFASGLFLLLLEKRPKKKRDKSCSSFVL